MVNIASLLALALSARAITLNKFQLASGADAVCDDKATEGVAWGIVIDGRNADQGPNAYGENYIARVLRQVQGAQMLADDAGPELRYSDWANLTHNRHYRTYSNPIHNEVQTCQKSVFDKTRINDIFDGGHGITIMDRKYKDLLDRKQAKDYEEAISGLIAQYNKKLKVAQNDEDKLHAIAFLMRNLAYLHPLADENGRSRILLTQFELRRLKLGCGTMLYNNNKDIYFQTEEEFVGKLKEGLQKYREAEATGQNPWQEKDAKQKHKEAFPNKHASKLESCWHNFCNKDWNDHTVEGHKACTGTAIALREKRTWRFADILGEERSVMGGAKVTYHKQQ